MKTQWSNHQLLVRVDRGRRVKRCRDEGLLNGKYCWRNLQWPGWFR